MTIGPDIDSFVPANGMKLHYTDWNPSAGNTTLLVHGLNRELHVWDSVAARLAAHRRVICVDLRGHGRSDWAQDGYALESFTADLIAMLEVLGIDEIQLVGHSLGARIGIVFAATWDGNLRHLLLSDSGPEFPLPQALALRKSSRSRTTSFASADEALRAMRAANPDWKDEFHLNSLEHEHRTNWVGKIVRRSDPELLWMVETEWVDGNPYLWECWSRITAPITMLWASESGFLDDRIIGRMRDEQPAMELCRPQGSHWYLRQSPEEFLRFAETALAPTKVDAG